MTHARVTSSISFIRHPMVLPLVMAIAASIFLYSYFLIKAVDNGGDIGRMHVMISEVSSSLSELESTYITLKNGLSLEEAYARGFTHDVNPVYISATDTRTTVALNR